MLHGLASLILSPASSCILIPFSSNLSAHQSHWTSFLLSFTPWHCITKAWKLLIQKSRAGVDPAQLPIGQSSRMWKGRTKVVYNTRHYFWEEREDTAKRGHFSGASQTGLSDLVSYKVFQLWVRSLMFALCLKLWEAKF